MEHLLSTPGIDVNTRVGVFNDQVIMICTRMVLNTILYMDGDVKKQDHRAAASKPTQCVPWYLLPFNPITMFVSCMYISVNVYTLSMLYMKDHVNDSCLYYMYMCTLYPPC